jgi:hypothetical protein
MPDLPLLERKENTRVTTDDRGWEPQPAYEELVALCVKAREDWREEDIRGALVNAKTTGMRWGTAIRTMGRLIDDPQAEPRDLCYDYRKPSSPPPDVVQSAKERALADYVKDQPWYQRAHPEQR